MKKPATNRNERLVSDLSVQNDKAVKGGATTTNAPVKYLEFKLKEVLISGVISG